MSFARTVKNELITIPVNHNEMLAEFSAFLNFSCDFHIEEGVKMLDFMTKNPAITKRFLLLTKSLYQADTILLTKDQQKFTKKPLIILRVIKNVEAIIKEHDYLIDPIKKIEELTIDHANKVAFLRAAFLTSGSVNDPKTAEYHLEIFVNKKEEVVLIQSIMNYFNFNARVTKRRNGFICYLKDAETISDFIQLVGAYNSVFKFEDVRIKRDFNNSINRLINCEIANERKSVEASDKQMKYINILRKHEFYLEIDSKLLKVMELREKYVDISLTDLVKLYKEEYNEEISRSGLNHRFNKIKALAESISAKGEQK